MALLAGPIICASLLQVANGFIDTIMLGRYDSGHLAAGALGASLWVFVMLAGMGFSMGMAPIVAQLQGSNQQNKVAGVFQQGVWLCLFLGIIMFVLLRLIANGLAYAGQDPSIVPLTKEYLLIVSWGLAFSQVYLAGRYLSDGIEHTRPMMLIQLILLPINTLGNYLLIFGNWGFPELGVRGAAIATSVTLILGFILMLLNLKLDQRYHGFSLFSNFQMPSIKPLHEILAISVPIAIAMILETSLFAAIALLMGKIGILSLAGHQIAINYASLMFMIPLGVSMAATVRVGNAVGRADYTGAKLRGWVAIGLSLVFMICSAIILLFFNQQIASVYTNDKQLISVAAGLLTLAGLFQISDGIQISASGALRGYKDTKVPMLINFLGYWVIGFPLAYYLGFKLDFQTTGLWWGLIAGLSTTAVLLLIRFKRFSINKPELKSV